MVVYRVLWPSGDKKKKELWTLLESLSHWSNLPWVCMGDFNEIMHAKEKVSGGLGWKGR